MVERRESREVFVGELGIGGEHPVRVQSMTSTDTRDVPATVAEIERLKEAGCELVRVAVPDNDAAVQLEKIRDSIDLPLIADIHFHYRFALMAIKAGIPKIRINPGNVGGLEKFAEVVDAAGKAGTAMRIGVNSGSVEKDLLEKYGYPTADALVESALRYIEFCEKQDYYDHIVSIKSSDVRNNIESNRLLASETDCPIHLGLTEAGPGGSGIVKSALGIGVLLLEGIGDTIRVSLTDPPEEEIPVAYDILRATGRRVRSPDVVACPTCGRIEVELIPLVEELQKRLRGVTKPLRISVLGCAVNGPGEARESDLGVAAGKGMGMIFKRGKMLRKVREEEMVDALMEEVERFEMENGSGSGEPSSQSG